LSNAGKSVRSNLTANDIIAIDMDGKPVGPRRRAADGISFAYGDLPAARPDVNAVAAHASTLVHAFQHDGASACSR